MSANLSSCKVLRVALTGTTAQTIAVADFAPQGCTVRDITVEVTTAGTAVTIAGGGNNLLAVANAPTTGVGGFQIALSATSANLQLAYSDSLVLTPTGANTVVKVNIFFGDFTPSTITVS
jgi:hypothetical protein